MNALGLNSNQCHAEKHITSCLLVVILFFIFYWGGGLSCGNYRMVDEHKKWKSNLNLVYGSTGLKKISADTKWANLPLTSSSEGGISKQKVSLFILILCRPIIYSTNSLSKHAQISYFYSQSALQSDNCLGKKSLFFLSWTATNNTFSCLKMSFVKTSL